MPVESQISLPYVNKRKRSPEYYERRRDYNARYYQEHRDKYRQYQQDYLKANREQMREAGQRHRFRKYYGITLDQYRALVESQNGLCKICGGLPGKYRLNVDHDHITNEVRGLLCHKCNKALGLINDSPEILRSMLSYLDRKSKI